MDVSPMVFFSMRKIYFQEVGCTAYISAADFLDISYKII